MFPLPAIIAPLVYFVDDDDVVFVCFQMVPARRHFFCLFCAKGHGKSPLVVEEGEFYLICGRYEM